MHGAGKSIRCGIFTSILGCIAAGLVSAVASPAFADEEREENESSESRPQYFTLDRLDGYLEFESQFDQTRVRSERRQRRGTQWSQTNRDWTLEERVGLRLDGSILDPALIRYQADLSFALTQSNYTERGPNYDETDDDSGYLALYDVRFDLFQGRPYSGSVYAFRRDDRINRRFQPSLDETQTGHGTSWSYVEDKLSMQLNYDYLETDRVGNNDRYDDEHYTDSVLTYSLDYDFSENHKVSFSYEHAESKQEFQGLTEGFMTTRDLFTLDHRYGFGPEDKHELWTRVRWQEESGDFARDIFEIGPQLTLHHSDNLETIYRYQFNRENYESFDVSTHRADFQLVHQLYSNLTTTVDVFGLYEDIKDDVKTTQYGALVDWQYNRSNAYGHFYANLGLQYDTEEMRGDNGARLVLNESATFRDPVQVVLRNRNVRLGSIVVTDATNRRIYLTGRDYVIVRTANVTQLYRVPTGQIADGDTVLIDYEYETPADGTLDTFRADMSIEQRFDNGMTPYYRLSYRNQHADDDALGFARVADRTDHHRLGVNYEKDRYTLGAELELFDDSVLPYDAFHVNGLYRFIRSAEHTLDGGVRYSRFCFDEEYGDRNVHWLDFQLDHRWRLRDDLSTFERVTYRWQDDSIRGTTNGWDVTAGLDYVIGDLTAQLVLEYDRLDLPESQEDDLGVYFRLRRDFGNVLASR